MMIIYAIQQQSATAQSPSQLLPQSNGWQKQSAEDLIVAAVGDSKAESEAKVTFTNIKIEKPDTFVFLGDASYIDDNGKVWTDLIDSIELEDIIQVIKGNHEDQEENAKKNSIWYGKLVAFIIGNKKWYHMKCIVSPNKINVKIRLIRRG